MDSMKKVPAHAGNPNVNKKIQLPCKYCSSILQSQYIDNEKLEQVMSFANKQFNTLRTNFSPSEEESENTLKLMKKFSDEKKNQKAFNLEMCKLLKTDKDGVLDLRLSVLDWMTIVFNKLKLNEITRMLALEIYDSMLNIYKFDLSVSDYHLISIASIFVASKFEEIKPISLDNTVKSLSRGKFQKNDITNAELIILSKLNFKMPKVIFIDFITIIIQMVYSLKAGSTPSPTISTKRELAANPEEKKEKMFIRSNKVKSRTEVRGAKIIEKNSELYENVIDDYGNCLYKNTVFGFCKKVYRLVCMDYELSKLYDTYPLYLSILYFSFTYINNIVHYHRHFNDSLFISVSEKFGVSKQELEEISNRILALLKNQELEMPYMRSELEIFRDLYKEEK